MNAWIIVGIIVGTITTIGLIGWKIYYYTTIKELREEIRRIYS